jgi:hypothetical protein
LSGQHRVRRARSGTDSPIQQKRSFCHAPTPEAAARAVLDAFRPVTFLIEPLDETPAQRAEEE